MKTEQQLIADPSNTGQVGAWDGDEGAFWATEAQRFDDSMTRYHGPFLGAAAVGSHDRVLDVGCGAGQTTRDVARLASNGTALGVDLSSEMLARGRATAAAEGLDNVEFLHADAQIQPFETAGFDVVISRMGSMFFGDPITAFTNLGRALRPGGRLVLLAWQGLAENEWLTEFRAAMAVGRDLPAPPPDVPSPFALSEPDRVRTILGGAGFADVTFEGLHELMRFGSDHDDALPFILGPTAWMLDGLDPAEREAALSALSATIAEHIGDDGVTYRSAAWIIRAHRP